MGVHHVEAHSLISTRGVMSKQVHASKLPRQNSVTAALLQCTARLVCCIHRTGESQGNALAQLTLTRADLGFSASSVLRLGSLTCLMRVKLTGARRQFFQQEDGEES